MVDPIYTYVAGIAFLVLIIAPVLYLLFISRGADEQDEIPGESVVGGVGSAAEAASDESAETDAEEESAENAEESDDEATEDAAEGDDEA